MREKNSDRRVQRTRHALRKAFHELVNEIGYDQVTVEAMTMRANLARTTFYLHYQDKEDLLLEDFESLMAEIAHHITQIVTNLKTESLSTEIPKILTQPATMIFQYAARHAELFRRSLNGSGAAKVRRCLQKIIVDTFEELSQLRLEDHEYRLSPQVPLEVVGNTYAGAIIGMIAWWLENDAPYSAEQMATMFNQITLPGVIKALELPFLD